MRELEKLSETTRRFLESVPGTLTYANVREEAVKGSLALAEVMRASVAEYGPRSVYARHAGVRTAPEAGRGAGWVQGERCMCRFHPWLPGPM